MDTTSSVDPSAASTAPLSTPATAAQNQLVVRTANLAAGFFDHSSFPVSAEILHNLFSRMIFQNFAVVKSLTESCFFYHAKNLLFSMRVIFYSSSKTSQRQLSTLNQKFEKFLQQLGRLHLFQIDYLEMAGFR
jgi:hypothetical protein